jgi:hypothetical protein
MREREKTVGGVVRDATVWRGSLKGSQAVPASPSGRGVSTDEREREESWGVVVRDTTVWRGCNRNIIWQFGRFPGSAR